MDELALGMIQGKTTGRALARASKKAADNWWIFSRAAFVPFIIYPVIDVFGGNVSKMVRFRILVSFQ